MTDYLSLRHWLSVDLAMPLVQVDRLIQRAPYTYKKYRIRKNSGGYREIAQPSRETKLVQRWLLSNVFVDLPVHGAATAYRNGIGIKDNAFRHSDNDYLSKFDFQSFFPSIKSSDLALHFEQYIPSLSAQDCQDAARLCSVIHRGTKSLRLSIGAPSSPLLSNSVMFQFDGVLSNWSNSNNIVYSRYADDLTLSTSISGMSSQIEEGVRSAMRNLEYPSLRLNSRKTVTLSKKNQRRVTGLVINNEGNVSLGRHKKRAISSMVHSYSLGKLAEDRIGELQGHLGFAKGVEPLYLSRLRGKYGSALISEILSYRTSDD